MKAASHQHFVSPPLNLSQSVLSVHRDPLCLPETSCCCWGWPDCTECNRPPYWRHLWRNTAARERWAGLRVKVRLKLKMHFITCCSNKPGHVFSSGSRDTSTFVLIKQRQSQFNASEWTETVHWYNHSELHEVFTLYTEQFTGRY